MCFALSNFVKQATPPTASYSLSLHDALPISEASYAYSGRSLGDTAIVGRLYDRLQNRFTLNALAVVLDRPYDPAKFSAGFHTELLVGQDATVIQSNGLFAGAATPVPVDVPHLYVTLNVPTPSGNGLHLK